MVLDLYIFKKKKKCRKMRGERERELFTAITTSQQYGAL
jgi:hypothetical protein